MTLRMLMEFAAVVDRNASADVKSVEKTLHDRLLVAAGPSRRGGVRWVHFDATSEHAITWMRDNLAPGADLDGLIDYLAAAPQGLLIVASCPVADDC